MMPTSEPAFYKNIMISRNARPARAYIDELFPDVLEGRIQPGRVFNQTVGLDGVPDGCLSMNDLESIKVMIKP
jgi:threonine dehydrogenase-like Zn-dependent dehydrogenase